MQRKAFVGSRFYAWAECGCKGTPGPRDRGDYYVHGSELCAVHAKVEGNFPKDQERRM